jgi:hypothetical protein
VAIRQVDRKWSALGCPKCCKRKGCWLWNMSRCCGRETRWWSVRVQVRAEQLGRQHQRGLAENDHSFSFPTWTGVLDQRGGGGVGGTMGKGKKEGRRVCDSGAAVSHACVRPSPCTSTSLTLLLPGPCASKSRGGGSASAGAGLARLATRRSGSRGVGVSKQMSKAGKTA